MLPAPAVAVILTLSSNEAAAASLSNVARSTWPALVVPVTDATGPGAEFQLVDLDSVRPGQRLTERRRQKNLVQLGLVPEGHVRPLDRLRFLHAYDRGEGRYFSRDWIESLDRRLADEVIRIMARISEKETAHALDPEVCDPRFRTEAADLTHEFEASRAGQKPGRRGGP